ncbi:MAG: tripartite tricarboxylate transporter TctB family protein, partial [Halobacteria archaeon]
ATLSIFIFGILLPILGFFFSTLIMMILLIPISSGKSKIRRLYVFYLAIMIAIASWLIFSLILNTPFPGPRFMGVWL